jgi:hypothetical protein
MHFINRNIESICTTKGLTVKRIFLCILFCIIGNVYGMERLFEPVTVYLNGHDIVTRIHALGLELPLDPDDFRNEGKIELSKVDFSQATREQHAREFAAAQELEKSGSSDAALRAYLRLANEWDRAATHHLDYNGRNGSKLLQIRPKAHWGLFYNRLRHLDRELRARETLRRCEEAGSYGILAHFARKRGLLPEGYDDIGVPSVRLPKSPSPATEVLEEASSPRRGSGASNGSGDSDVTTVAGPSVVDPTHVEPEADSEEETESLLPAAEAPPADPSLLGLRKRIVGNG